MKKIILIVSTVIFFAAIMAINNSCNKTSDIDLSDKELILNIRTQKGHKIADNVSELKQEISSLLTEVYGEYKLFKLVQIEAVDISSGYVSYIRYETADGFDGTIIKTNIQATTIDSNIVVKETRKRKGLFKLKGIENTAKWNGSIYTCTNLGDDCSCIPTFTSSSDGIVHYSCGDCDNCELAIQF